MRRASRVKGDLHSRFASLRDDVVSLFEICEKEALGK